MNFPITIAVNAHCELAENPLWDEREKCVYWTDIPAGKLFRFDPQTNVCNCIYGGEVVGGFTLQEDGKLLLFRVNDIALLDATGKVSVVRQFEDESMTRFNDVTADPSGRIFAGSIGKTKQSGGLYRVECDGSIEKLFDGTGCSNGMGFSPDRKTFYWTCTTTREIFEFDYDVGSGKISNRRSFYRVPPEEGLPDGLAVDSEGFIWSARWGGFSIIRHAPDGTVLGSIRFPVRNITSLCFGGEKLDRVFVSSAKEPGENPPEAGALFHFCAPAKGRTEFRSRIR